MGNCLIRGLLLALLSGAAALSHELLWTRRLTDVLGASQQATAAVLGCFFLGLALGSGWATRLTKRPSQPWLVVSLIEFGIALATLPALTLTTWTGPIWPLLGTTGLLGWPGSLTKLVLPVLVVVPPSFLMGMTLPLMVFAVVQRQGALARQGMWLYAANTLGGVLGLLATVLITLPWLGAAGAMSWAIALNLIVALGCLETSRRRAWVDRRETGPAAGSAAAAGAVPADRVRPVSFRGSLVVSFGSGFGILALEILALHLVLNVWPSCLFATTAVLAPVIGLLALAAWLAPYLVSWLGPARQLLPAVLALTAAATVVAPVAFMRLTGQMAPPADTGGVFSFVAVVAGHVLATSGPALLVAGLVLPLTSCWYGSEARDRTGRGWGWLLAANGIGGLTGATAAGSLLIPRFGLHSGFTAIAACYAVLAVALCWLVDGSKKTWAVAGLAVLLTAVGGLWVRQLPLMTPRPDFQIVDIRCGREGVVAVVDQVGPDATRTWRRSIVQSNQFQLGSLGAIHSQRRKMLLPLLLHAAPERVATIGMATGITAGAALDYEAVQSLTAVEISPLITAAAGRYFATANRHLCDDPRTEVAVEDGRTYLAASRAAYDVVVGDLFRPWALGVGRLYSLEHFQAVRRALRPGGMYCQWLPMYQLEAPQFEVILATFQQAFSPVHLVRGSFRSTVPAIGLVGFRTGAIDWHGLAARCRALRRADRVVDPSLRRVEGVFMYYLGAITTQAGPRRFANTLDNAWIEIDAGRGRVSQATRQAYLERERWIRFCAELTNRLDYHAGAPAEARRWSELGQRIGGLHLALRRGAPVARALTEAINRALPPDFYDDRRADWSAWPVPRSAGNGNDQTGGANDPAP